MTIQGGNLHSIRDFKHPCEGGFSYKTGTVNKEMSTHGGIYQLNKRYDYHLTLIHKMISTMGQGGSLKKS